MVSVRVGGNLVSVKADKSFRSGIDQDVSFGILAGICHLFDTQTGARIELIPSNPKAENWVATMSPPLNRRGKMFLER